MRRSRSANLQAEIAAFVASDAYRRAERAFEDHVVAMIGYAERVPTYFGDNRGKCPCFIALTGNLAVYVRNEERRQPMYPLRVHGQTFVPTERHGAKLKAEIDRAWVGDLPDAILRHAWRDAGSRPAQLWDFLLEAAVLACAERGEDIDAYNAKGREQRIIQSMEKRRLAP